MSSQCLIRMIRAETVHIAMHLRYQEIMITLKVHDSTSSNNRPFGTASLRTPELKYFHIISLPTNVLNVLQPIRKSEGSLRLKVDSTLQLMQGHP